MEQAKIDELNKIYDDFLKEFPIERLEKLSLDEYTNLEKSNSFCYWLEKRTENLGSIWGGSSYKFGIFKWDNEPKYSAKAKNDDKYAWYLKYGNTAQEAFENIRKNIIEIAKNSSAGEFEKIDEIDLGDAYKWKIAFLYSNKKLLNCYEKTGLKWIAKKQGMEINPKVQISQIQAFLMSKKGNENIFAYAKRLWQEWQNSNEYKTSKNKNNDEIGDEMMENKLIDEIVNVLKYKKNIILQGAPGVGKTYNTAMIALKICGVDNVNFGNHTEVMEKYEELQESGQIEFVTFHQSMDYEDFVEGIKPELNKNNENNNVINYKVKKGIFREICKRAKSQVDNNDCEIIDLSTTKIYKMSLGRYDNKVDIEIFKYCIKNNKIALGYSDEDNAFFKTFKYKIQKNKDMVVITNKEDEIRAICKVIGDLETKESKEANNIRYDNFREVEWLWETNDKNDYITLDDKLDYKTIYELRDEKLKLITNKISKFQEKIDKYPNKSGKKYKLVLNGQNDNVVSQSNKNYVLIIDEINRGNVSKIFGELITLLESDKRLGAEHPIKVALPYSSKDENDKIFGIPSNLYIIGTMNTTDRSVGNIDYAVRRRFAFVTLPADENAINGGVNKNLFKAVKSFIENNNSGEIELDDLIVGHSYFMADSDEQLKLKLKYEILPLLEEYYKDGILKEKPKADEFFEILNSSNNGE